MNSKVIETLNELLAVYQMANIQHQTHAALFRAWGYEKLADITVEHIADEPETITELQNRILDLGGEISYIPYRSRLSARIFTRHLRRIWLCKLTSDRN